MLAWHRLGGRGTLPKCSLGLKILYKPWDGTRKLLLQPNVHSVWFGVRHHIRFQTNRGSCCAEIKEPSSLFCYIYQSVIRDFSHTGFNTYCRYRTANSPVKVSTVVVLLVTYKRSEWKLSYTYTKYIFYWAIWPLKLSGGGVQFSISCWTKLSIPWSSTICTS